MNILVTGSTGFVGRHLVPGFLQDGHKVFELTRNIDASIDLFGSSTQKYQLSDDQVALKNVIQRFNPDVCIHLAAFLNSADDYGTMLKLIDSNIFFLCRVLDSLKGCSLKLFINTGTFAEYYKGNNKLDPAYLYAATKSASRAFVNYYTSSYNFKSATVVPYTIYGGIDTQKKIIDHIFDSLNNDRPTDLTLGEQILDFIHIVDIVRFYRSLINDPDSVPDDSIFHLGTGIGHTIKELAKIIEDKAGKKANIQWGAKSYRNKDVFYAVANTSLQYRIWKWRPTISLEQGIEEYLVNKTRNVK